MSKILKTRKRNFSDEIEAVKSRLPEGGTRFQLFGARVVSIAALIEKIPSLTTANSDRRCYLEITRYVPVAVVAAIEGWLRLWVAHLIDQSHQFSENARAGFNELKFDYDMVMGLAEKKHTPGQIIAHFTKPHQISNVLSTLDSLTGVNVATLMKDSTVSDGRQSARFSDNGLYDRCFLALENIYKQRHVICHELAPNYPPHSSEFQNHFKAATIFISVCDQVLEDILRKDLATNPGELGNSD